MNSGSVDLIYLDPPFNSNANYAAPIGSKAAGAEFKDTWGLDDLKIAWLDLIEAKHPRLRHVIQAAMTDSDKSCLIYMAARWLEMHRLMKSTGSISTFTAIPPWERISNCCWMRFSERVTSGMKSYGTTTTELQT